MKINISTITRILIPIILIGGLTFCTDTTSQDPDPINPREKFLGIWTVDESCVRLDYEAEIIADANNDTKILIENFAFTGPGYDPAYGFVDGNVINLPQQTIGDNWTVSGTGYWQSTGTILWNYYIEIGANGSNCQADYR